STNFAVTAPLTGSGGFDGNYGDYMIGNSGSYLLELADIEGGGDNTRISYFTPEIGGFQGGIGYATSEDEGKGGGDHRIGGVGDIFDIGANYTADVGGFNVVIGGGYITGSGEDDGDDLTGYHLGANVGFGGFTVGGAYVAATDHPDAVIDEEETWQAGVTYEFGAWTIGANAAFDTRELTTGDDVDTDIYAVGGDYAVAPGLSVYADLMFVDADGGFVDSDGDAVVDNEATVFVVGTSVAF
ncbi:MAG TPA: porin, partial [Alphaproteobacteria bacterium]|nr:porin [Alphaproteobacteria bacterium]